MTIAGLNVRLDIWRVTTGDDDDVGGAMVTGTPVYQGVMARFQADPPNLLLLQQGLETVPTFTATVIPGTLDIQERDEVVLSAPSDHIYYNQYFRVVGVQYSSFNPRDSRNYVILHLQKSRTAHANTINQ